MWDEENVLPYVARIEEIANRIKDSHGLNNGGQVDNAFEQNLERDVEKSQSFEFFVLAILNFRKATLAYFDSKRRKKLTFLKF